MSLLVQIGYLPEKKIPVHISVVGTPLIMQLDKVLLPGFPRNPAMPQPPTPLLAKLPSKAASAPGRGRTQELLQTADDGVTAGMELNFGQLLTDTPATRTFYVFNTACLPVQLNWVFHRCVHLAWSLAHCFSAISCVDHSMHIWLGTTCIAAKHAAAVADLRVQALVKALLWDESSG